MVTAIFLNQKRISSEFLNGATRELRGMDSGKFKRKLSDVNTRAVPRRQNELVGKFKMAAGDKVSIRGQVMEYTYIPKGIKKNVKIVAHMHVIS